MRYLQFIDAEDNSNRYINAYSLLEQYERMGRSIRKTVLQIVARAATIDFKNRKFYVCFETEQIILQLPVIAISASIEIY